MFFTQGIFYSCLSVGSAGFLVNEAVPDFMISIRFQTEWETMIHLILRMCTDLEHGFCTGTFILGNKSGFPTPLFFTSLQFSISENNHCFVSSCNGLIAVFRGKSKADSGCFGDIDDDNLHLKMEFLSLVTHRVINQWGTGLLVITI